ncbi:hypothetical protein PHISP_02912 [Aspergillus sp. HF37]|nr:hypothetical protein PHISP_02912 [Aspergillus sp. HF37]
MFPTRVLRMQATRPLYYAAPWYATLPWSSSFAAKIRGLSGVYGLTSVLAHTISQRLRRLRKIPPELIPLGVVLGAAVGAAIYSSVRKLMTDKTLRLHRSKPEDH